MAGSKTFTPADNFTPVINKLIKCSDGYYYAITDEGLFQLNNKRFIKMDLKDCLKELNLFR
jgi:hypothetical protein